MLERLNQHIELLVKRYPALNSVKADIVEAYAVIAKSYKKGGKLLLAGNGGSAADCAHITGELMKGFKMKRALPQLERDALLNVDPILGAELADKLQKALPCISLVEHTALNTAFQNDVDGLMCVAQQVNGYGCNGDVFLGISTSGNSKNILYAAIAAKAKNMVTIAFTGATGGRLATICDIAIKIPEKETYIIQEYCLPIYHCLCLMLEDDFFGCEC